MALRTNFLLVAHYSLLLTRYYLLVTSCYFLVTFYLLLVTFHSLLVTTYSLLITFYLLFLFINFYYLLVKHWKLGDVKNLNISQYASNLHIKRLKELQNLFQLSINNFRSPRNAVKLTAKTYVSPHLKHFANYKAAISELWAVFESLYTQLKRAEYCST